MPWVSAVLPGTQRPDQDDEVAGRSSVGERAAERLGVLRRRQHVLALHGALPRRRLQVGQQRGPRGAVRAEPDGRRRVVGRPDGPAVDHGAAGPRTWASTVRGPRNHFAADSPSATTTGRVEQLELAVQPAAAPGHLGRLRRPVARRPALHDVEHGGLRAVQAGLGEQLVEQRAGPARRTAGRSRPRSRRAPPRRARPAGGRTTGTSPTTTCCRVAASSGQATQERAVAASVAQSGAAAAMRATSSAAASSRGGRRAATPEP